MPVSTSQRYRLRNPASGREIVIEADGASSYLDRESHTTMEVVGRLLPLAPSASRLPWAVENLRFCPWCKQLAAAGPEGPQRLPHVRSAHGAAERSAGWLVIARVCIALVLALAGASALAGCGGGSGNADVVPKSTPDITPPADTSAERSALQTTSTSTNATKSTTSSTSTSSEAGGEGSSSAGGEESSSASGEGTASGGATAEEKEKSSSSGEKSAAGSSPTGGAGAPSGK